MLHAYNNNYENFIVYYGDSGVLQTIENQKLSYQGNIEVVMCLQCCMNGAGAPPIWKIYDGDSVLLATKKQLSCVQGKGFQLPH